MIERGLLGTQQRILSEDETRVNVRKAPFQTLNITATTIGAAQDFHVVPEGQAVMVERLSVCNTTGTAATLSLYIVPDGGTAGVTNAAMVGFSVAANDVVEIGERIGGLWGSLATAKVFSGTNGALTLSGHYGQVY